VRRASLHGFALAVGPLLGAVTIAASCIVDIDLGQRSEPVQAGGGGLGGAGGALGGFGGFDPACDDLFADVDHDGYTIATGDCDDCDPNVNPNAVEVITPPGDPRGNPRDEDCDGDVDEEEPLCDTGLLLADPNPHSAARAIDLCRASPATSRWGLVRADWVLPDGNTIDGAHLGAFHRGHGIVDAFGPFVDVRRGARMLVLSSGYARRPTDPDYGGRKFDKNYVSSHPPGFPKESASCQGVISGQPHDGIALEVVLRTPSNVTGFSFEFDFYTFEWPEFVCQIFNDFFVAILSPKPAALPDGSISFDSLGNPVSVNSAFMSVCGCEGNPPLPCTTLNPPFKQYACPSGDVELLGTGFGLDSEDHLDHAATGWLKTSTSVDPNEEVSIRFAVYDSQDGTYDSLALVDNFRWIAEPGQGTVTEPVQ
jgi:hypothetical protein